MGARGALSELANVLRCVAFGHGCALLLPNSRVASAGAALRWAAMVCRSSETILGGPAAPWSLSVGCAHPPVHCRRIVRALGLRGGSAVWPDDGVPLLGRLLRGAHRVCI